MASLNKTPLLSVTAANNSQHPFRKTQYFATFTASLVAFSIGMILAYLSPASYQIRNASSTRLDLDVRISIPTPAIISTSTPAKISTLIYAGIATANTHSNQSSEANIEYAQVSDDRLARSKRLAFKSEDENNSEINPPSKEHVGHTYETEATLKDVPLTVRKLSHGANSTITDKLSLSHDLNKTGNAKEEAIKMTVNELAWFSSSVTLGAVAGWLLGSTIQNGLGRKGSIMVAVLPALTGWFLIGFGQDMNYFIIGRVFTGFFVGCAALSAIIYVAEISSPEIRGFLTMFVDLSLSLGKLFVVVLGAFMHWQDLALASTAPIFLLFLCMVFCKESPSYLINKGNYDGAQASLQYFRGPGTDVSFEFESLKTYQIEETKNKFTCSHMKRPHVYKPLCIGLVIGMFVQLCGIDMLTFNLASIFKQSGSQLSDSGCSIVVICFQVIGNAVGIICIENSGRKKLLIASSIGMTIAYVCLGGYFFALQVAETWAQQKVFWLPLLAVILFMLSFSVGFGPVPLILIGEMFPPSIRETAAGLMGATIFATAFVVIFSYDAMQTALTLGGFYWVFAVFCILAGVFVAVFVKETKGKTLADVSAMFGGGSSNYIALEPTQTHQDAGRGSVSNQTVGHSQDIQNSQGVNGLPS
nr:Major facilitator sugar transporter-like [Trinorchestia longiramus]